MIIFFLSIGFILLINIDLKNNPELPVEDIFESEEINSSVILRIADQGIGIPYEERTKVFERFYRIEDEETRSSKGTGLGLFLVDEIVKIHGGKITCKDNSPKGTIFEIKFRTNNG